jgi:hypothetical protein
MAVVCCALGADRGGRRRDAPPFREGEGGMTWLLIAALALVVLLVLTFVFRTPRKGWEAIASALVLGLAGYALQGHPGQAGQPHEVAKSNIFATTLVDERQKVVGATVQVSSWEMVADALMRHGDYADAATMLKGAVEKTPKTAPPGWRWPARWWGMPMARCRRPRSMPSARRRRPILPRRGRRCFWGWRWPDRGSLTMPARCGSICCRKLRPMRLAARSGRAAAAAGPDHRHDPRGAGDANVPITAANIA